MPDDVRNEEEEIISRIDTTYSVFSRENNEPRGVRDIAEQLGEWLSKYFQCVTTVVVLDVSLMDALGSESDSCLSRICLCGTFGIPARLPFPPKYAASDLLLIPP